MTELPESFEELEKLGFVKTDKPKKCRGRNCRKLVQWMISPRNKRIPFDVETARRHYLNCPDFEFLKTRGLKI